MYIGITKREKTKDLFRRTHAKSHAHFYLLCNIVYVHVYSFVAIYPRYITYLREEKDEGTRDGKVVLEFLSFFFSSFYFHFLTKQMHFLSSIVL